MFHCCVVVVDPQEKKRVVDVGPKVHGIHFVLTDVW